MIFKFGKHRPVIHKSSYVYKTASVIGNVTIGKNVYIGPGAAIRGDWGEIIIEDGCNVQENCVIHMFPGVTVLLKESAHIGHGAIIHGAVIGKNSLIGMNAVIMDNAIVGDECIVGALSFIPAEMKIPKRKIVVGNPAKIIKDVSNGMLEWKSKGTMLYQRQPKQLQETLEECMPLRNSPKRKSIQAVNYKTWKETKSRK